MAKLNVSKITKKVLDLLPLNGSKVSLGAIFTLFGVIASYFPGVNLLEVVKAILANPTKAGITAVIVGLIHKVLKAKFPEAQY